MRSWIKLVVVVVFIILWCYLAFSGLVKLPELDIMNMAFHNKIDLKSVNIFEKPLPENIKLEGINIETGFTDVKGVKVFYRKASPPGDSSGQSILLLHGRSFTSETWEKLGTIQLMAALGYLVVAVDLPGYGKTQENYKGDRSEFVQYLVKSHLLSETHPVIISPSMNGIYSIGFVGKYADLISGFIPVAPVATDTVPQAVLREVRVPTIILTGENDDTPMAKQAPENLRVMPNSIEVVLKNAGHAAYLNQPQMFHKLLYNFMVVLNQ